MERSMVKEFKSSSSSLFQSTVLGTHSMMTHRSPPKYEDHLLHKSRIAHLPNPSKTDLCDKKDFVLIFQTIEIQRLTEELTLTRTRLRELESRTLNASSYEVQIRELIEKCNKLENEKYSYRQELSQTKEMSENIFNELSLLRSRYGELDFTLVEKYKLEKSRNEELQMEVEKWKTRYNSLDKSKSEEAESYRRMRESYNQSLLSREGKELMGRFEVEREELLGRLRERKEQVEEKELQLRKMMNALEQAQIQLKEEEQRIDDYEQKVAMLSQETYRLNELVRAKQEEIRGLKTANDHDFSMRISQITSIDQSKNLIAHRLRNMQDENDQLRAAVRELQGTVIGQKKRLAEMERVEFQLGEAKKDNENKYKIIERKDKKILVLEEEIRMKRRAQEELAQQKAVSLELGRQLQDLQRNLDARIQQLQALKAKYRQTLRQTEEHQKKVAIKLSQFTEIYLSIEKNYNNLRSVSQQTQQKSNLNELKLRQISLQLKEKDYKISSLQSQLKQTESKGSSRQEQLRKALTEVQSQLSRERFALEDQLAQERHNYSDKIRELEVQNQRKSAETAELKRMISGLAGFQTDMEHRFAAYTQEMKSLQNRLAGIERIILALKGSVESKYRSAQENQYKLKMVEHRYQELYEWFQQYSQRTNLSPDPSPPRKSLSPYRRDSPERNYPQGQQSLFAFPASPRDIREQGIENVNRGNSEPNPKELPIEWLLRWVLLCAEVETLRKKVGDKNAKMQTMRSSMANRAPTGNSGFYTVRENSLGRRQNAYY